MLQGSRATAPGDNGLTTNRGGVKGRLLTVIAALAAVCSPACARAQSIIEVFDFYSSLRAHVARYEKRSEVQNNLSRVGFNMQREFASQLTVFARCEWMVNLVENQIELDVESGESDEFGKIRRVSGTEAFEIRLGNLGIEYKNWGRLNMGKLWSVYSDVSLITDQFFAFGGRTAGAYTAGTDGGVLGTGRAAKAIAYRNDVRGFRLGGQVQLRGDIENRPDSWAVKLAWARQKVWYVGAAYNEALHKEDVVGKVPGARDKSRSFIVGAKYEKEPWYLAVNYARSESAEAAKLDTLTVVYDADGVEVYTHRYFGDRIQLIAGLNYQKPRNLYPDVDPDFHVENYIVGAGWYFNARTFIYSQVLINRSIDVYGNDERDVFIVGLWYDFSTFDYQSRIERGQEESPE
jgi:predicted porin